MELFSPVQGLFLFLTLWWSGSKYLICCNELQTCSGQFRLVQARTCRRSIPRSSNNSDWSTGSTYERNFSWIGPPNWRPTSASHRRRRFESYSCRTVSRQKTNTDRHYDDDTGTLPSKFLDIASKVVLDSFTTEEICWKKAEAIQVICKTKINK